MILVIGATGNAGRRVCEELDQQGVPYRALTRDAARAASHLPPHAEIVRGDLGRPSELRAALAGVEAVFLATPANRHMAEWQNAVVDESRTSGVRKIVKLSGPAADTASPPRLLRLHARIEAHLGRAGLDYCILRVSPFMQNILRHARSVRSDGAFYAAIDDGAISFADTRDVARVAVRCLLDKDLRNEAIDITGRTAENGYDLARRLTVVTGRRIEYVPVSVDRACAQLKAARLDDWQREAMSELFEAYSRGQGRFVSNDYRRIMGAEPGHVGRFIRQNQTAFL